ncbi:hypothetical protein RJD38_21325 (plasmid) [Vibrio scophthalmi]|uniref:hypothetical protein n=1 Tax=Vibrio scophthalmi TaxID=45658 RepID=UPI00080989EA|nr:hypothetical protein [Vibrio scophthalmi]ANS88187.1 hypothetical protein VSVS12_04489 [Vibrio scophthalmi]
MNSQDGRNRVLLELIVLRGQSKELRRQVCHAHSVMMVRNRLSKGGVVIGWLVSELDE